MARKLHPIWKVDLNKIKVSGMNQPEGTDKKITGKRKRSKVR